MLALILSPIRKYADFSGRATRGEYWLFMLAQGVVYGLVVTLAILSFAGNPHPSFMSVLAGLGGFLLMISFMNLGLFIPNLAVTVRRLHDTGHSAWYLLLNLPSVIANIATLGGVMGKASSAHLDGMTPALPGLILSLIGALCNLYFLWLVIKPGDEDTNRFGPAQGSFSPTPKAVKTAVDSPDLSRTKSAMDAAIAAHATAQAATLASRPQSAVAFGARSSAPRTSFGQRGLN